MNVDWGEIVRGILRAGLVDPADVARAASTASRSVQRWAAGEACPHRDSAGHLLELQAVLTVAAAVCRRDEARLWLRSPVPALGYGKPLDLLRAGEYRRVLQSLGAAGGGPGFTSAPRRAPRRPRPGCRKGSRPRRPHEETRP